MFTLTCLTVSQLVSALAPTFAVLALGRVLCALTHGLMWSVIAPLGVRLVPPTHAARATMAVYVGTGLALVVGSPMTAAMSQLWGWRAAVGVITAASAAVLVAARLTLPQMAKATAPAGPRGTRRGHHRNRRLLLLSGLTLVGVTGHFVSYTYIVVIIGDAVGIGGANLAWLLAAYGIAGLATMAVLARPGDRWPRAAIVGCLAAMAVAFVVLAALGSDGGPRTATTVVCGVLAIVLWGAAATAMPPMLQSAAMRHSPEDPDGASGLYVAAFQVGIMAGSLAGGLIYERAGLAAMIGTSAVLIAAALACVVVSRGLFSAPALSSEK